MIVPIPLFYIILNIENVKEGSFRRQLGHPAKVLRLHAQTFREKEHPSGTYQPMQSNESINKKI
jgi:hypothetical protein